MKNDRGEKTQFSIFQDLLLRRASRIADVAIADPLTSDYYSSHILLSLNIRTFAGGLRLRYN